jgi:hypothetical protein
MEQRIRTVAYDKVRSIDSKPTPIEACLAKRRSSLKPPRRRQPPAEVGTNLSSSDGAKLGWPWTRGATAWYSLTRRFLRLASERSDKGQNAGRQSDINAPVGLSLHHST